MRACLSFQVAEVGMAGVARKGCISEPGKSTRCAGASLTLDVCHVAARVVRGVRGLKPCRGQTECKCDAALGPPSAWVEPWGKGELSLVVLAPHPTAFGLR